MNREKTDFDRNLSKYFILVSGTKTDMMPPPWYIVNLLH